MIEKILLNENVNESKLMLLDKKIVQLQELEQLFDKPNDRLLDLLDGEDLTKEEDFCEEVEASIAFCQVKIKKQESSQQAKDLERTYLKESDAYKMGKNSVEPIRA